MKPFNIESIQEAIESTEGYEDHKDWRFTGMPECPDYGSRYDPCRVGCTETRCVAKRRDG